MSNKIKKIINKIVHHYNYKILLIILMTKIINYIDNYILAVHKNIFKYNNSNKISVKDLNLFK